MLNFFTNSKDYKLIWEEISKKEYGISTLAEEEYDYFYKCYCVDIYCLPLLNYVLWFNNYKMSQFTPKQYIKNAFNKGYTDVDEILTDYIIYREGVIF